MLHLIEKKTKRTTYIHRALLFFERKRYFFIFLLFIIALLSILRNIHVRRFTKNSNTKIASNLTINESHTEITPLYDLLNINTIYSPNLLNSQTNLRKRKDILLSNGCPVKADVRGNLGQPSVITNELVDDWLTDRWQAAKNMNGDPIPGVHFVEIDLLKECYISNILIDWETAYSNDWEIRGCSAGCDAGPDDPSGRVEAVDRVKWVMLATSSNIVSTRLSHQHVIQEIVIDKQERIRRVRLTILRPSTRWGSSIWRLQVWGSPIEARRRTGRYCSDRAQ